MTTPADSWPQPPIPTHLLHRRRPSSSPRLTLPVVLALLTIPAALALLFFPFPRVFPVSNQLWKSSVGVRMGWDSLKVALVLFAVVCGIFAPRRGDEVAVAEEAGSVGGNTARSSPKVEKAIGMSAQQWFQSIDRRIYELPEERVAVAGIGQVGRNGGSSRLDPVQESLPGMGEGRFRSFDDLAVDGYYRRFDRPAHVPLRRWQSGIDESEIEEIQVDTFVRGSQSTPSEAKPEQAKPKPPPNPPPAPPPPTATQKKRPAHDYDAVGARETPPPPPSPPPTPPPPPPPRPAHSPERTERRKSSATEELKVIIASVLSANKRKKRKSKARTIEESVGVRHGGDEMPDRRIPPPPPPPPQPQSFLSIFKMRTKTRRIHSASAQPPHPPPSPPDHAPRSTTRPPLPKKPKNIHESGNTMRPPAGKPAAPPQPPLSFYPDRRLRSAESRIAGADGDASGSSPAGKKRGTSSSDGGGAKGRGHVDGEDASKGGPGLFCESPDVNVKADTFIARLKDGWRMERMNSIREKHGLGPDPL